MVWMPKEDAASTTSLVRRFDTMSEIELKIDEKNMKKSVDSFCVFMDNNDCNNSLMICPLC